MEMYNAEKWWGDLGKFTKYALTKIHYPERKSEELSPEDIQSIYSKEMTEKNEDIDFRIRAIRNKICALLATHSKLNPHDPEDYEEIQNRYEEIETLKYELRLLQRTKVEGGLFIG